jgi:lysophospholipase L1-like esterase
MRMAFVTVIAFALGAGAALAADGDDDPCAVAQNLVHADFPLPQVANAIRQHHLDVVVVGTASSALGWPGGQTKAYPARLEAALTHKFPDVTVKVASYIKPRQTAADMVKAFDQIVDNAKPALVIWQTGTADAIRGVEPEAFSTALEEGVEALRAKHSDILFMNMQYSPRTESIIAADSYADAMRFVALQHEVLLFDRFAIMRHWSEMGTFDLFAATKNTETAESVHNCIGRLLADLINEGAGLTETVGKDAH